MSLLINSSEVPYQLGTLKIQEHLDTFEIKVTKDDLPLDIYIPFTGHTDLDETIGLLLFCITCVSHKPKNNIRVTIPCKWSFIFMTLFPHFSYAFHTKYHQKLRYTLLAFPPHSLKDKVKIRDLC